MEYSRFLDYLAADFARLRAVVPANPAAAVPTCPGWTVADLTRHVGAVYLHKTLAMREGAERDPWPPKDPVPHRRDHRAERAGQAPGRAGEGAFWPAPGR